MYGKTMIFKDPCLMMHICNLFEILKECCRPPYLLMVWCSGCQEQLLHLCMKQLELWIRAIVHVVYQVWSFNVEDYTSPKGCHDRFQIYPSWALVVCVWCLEKFYCNETWYNASSSYIPNHRRHNQEDTGDTCHDVATQTGRAWIQT